jgi:glycosyltransferase involved in cell wall biosynthesis
MGHDTPGITVLIATYNRAAMLNETLEALTRVDRTGIDCSIVVIDNNSSDSPAEIVKEYGTKIAAFLPEGAAPRQELCT